MARNITLEELKDIVIEENIELPKISDKSGYRKYSKNIALTVGFLLGVNEEAMMKRLESPDEFLPIKETLEKDEAAVAIRHLNNIRSNLMLHFKDVSRNLRNMNATFVPLDKMDIFKDDFKTISRMSISIITGKSDINEYLKRINNEIVKRIDKVEKYFPEWVRFKHIRTMFTMPNNIEEESKKFQCNQSLYPFQRYFNWREPFDCGYILSTDLDLLSVIYKNGNENFTDTDRVCDASDKVKNNINEFINTASKVQVFIDGENADPYRFASAIDSLKDHEIEKINKIVVYYDSEHTTKAWTSLKHFTYGIEVEAIPVERINGNKSLVDHRLVMGVSKAIFKENVDSIILVSSDSDFWSVIDASEDVRYLVMVESEKCGYDFKNLLRDKDVFYCYLDKFMTPDDDRFFNLVFKTELEKILKERFSLGNANELLKSVLTSCRATASKAEEDMLFDKYIKTIVLKINSDGDFVLETAT